MSNWERNTQSVPATRTLWSAARANDAPASIGLGRAEGVKANDTRRHSPKTEETVAAFAKFLRSCFFREPYL